MTSTKPEAMTSAELSTEQLASVQGGSSWSFIIPAIKDLPFGKPKQILYDILPPYDLLGRLFPSSSKT